MPSPALALLVAALASPPAAEGTSPQAADASAATGEGTPALVIHTARVDPHAVQQGLELRVGAGWRRWSIEVDDGSEPAQVDVLLRDAAGRVHTRSLTLEGETIDERSRALASSLALLVEQLAAGSEPDAAAALPSEPIPAPRTSSPRRSGFIGIGPRGALNARGPIDADVGASLVGGAWLVRDHMVPLGELAWARGRAGELVVHALRLGAGLLGGAAAAGGRLWGGGGALVRAQWARAHASATATGWWASPAVVGALQYRGRILVVSGFVGADLLLPPLRARGDAHALRWSAVRPMATLHVGLRLPPLRRER